MINKILIDVSIATGIIGLFYGVFGLIYILGS